jgi:hypothetical protein
VDSFAESIFTPMKFLRSKLSVQLIDVIFRVSLLTFVGLFVVEYVEPGFVTNWFNPVWVLIIMLMSGILATRKL